MLEQAGAILLGKLNMHEIALGVTNVNPHYGAARNPWERTRSTGGSSGGSAAAVRAGMCMGSLGTDTGGSIRIPASLCGVVGLKPTYGRVSLRGVIPLSRNLDHAGPLARSVRDTALLLQAIAGYDALDPYSVDTPVPDYLVGLDGGVRGWRVALAADDFFTEKTDAHNWNAVEEAAQVFKHLGARVERVEVPQAYAAAAANGLMTTSDGAAFHHERMAQRMGDFGEDIRLRLESGAAVTSTEYSQARHLQAELRRRYAEFLSRYDILLTPATPVAAPLIVLGPACHRAGAAADPLHLALQPGRAAGALLALRVHPHWFAPWLANRLAPLGGGDGFASGLCLRAGDSLATAMARNRLSASRAGSTGGNWGTRGAA